MSDQPAQPDKKISCMPYQSPEFGCECYNANYTGPLNQPQKPVITLETLAILLMDLNKRLVKIEEKING